MTEQQIKDTLSFLKEKFDKETAQAETGLEKKMLEREYYHNFDLVRQGINIFESKGGQNSDYECIGCGS